MSDDALLDDLVRAGRGEVAGKARVSRLRRRVAGAVSAGVSAGLTTGLASGSSASAGSAIASVSAVWLKVGAIGAIVAAVGGGTAAVIATSGSSEPVRVESPVPVRAAPAIDLDPSVEPAVVVEAVEEPVALESPPIVVRTPPEPVEEPAPVEPAADRSLGVVLLRRARERLPHDPSETLALVSEHEAAYGAFLAQEREVLRIDALSRLGSPEAAERARRFLERHPESVYRARVEALGRL